MRFAAELLPGLVCWRCSWTGAEQRVAPRPTPAALERSQKLTNHWGDAQVLAAPWESGPHYSVTLDQERFLGNADRQDTVPFPVGTPGDFLAWYRRELVRRISLGN